MLLSNAQTLGRLFAGLLLTVLGVAFAGCGTPGPRPAGNPSALPSNEPDPPPLASARMLAPLGGLPVSAGPAAAGATPSLPLPPLRLVEWGPRGRVSAAKALFLRFSEPMAGLDESADSESQPTTLPQPQIEITPPLHGRGYYQTPERWVFEPSDDLKPATRYSARLHPPLVAPSGSRWDGVPGPSSARDLIWEFESERPRVESSHAISEDERRSRTAPLLIEFTQRVSAAQVASYFRAHAFESGKAGPPIPLRVTQASSEDLRRYNGYAASSRDELSHWLKVQPQSLWPIGAMVRMQLQPGWLGEEGPLPADTPWQTEFHVIAALRLLRATCSATKPCGQEPIVLHFSNDIPHDELKKIRVTPQPEWLSVTSESGWGSWHDGAASDAEKGNGPRVEISGAFLSDQRYRVQIDAGLRDEHQQSLGKTVDLTAVFVRRPFLELSAESGILRGGEAQTVGVVSRFVQEVEVRAQLLDDEAAMRLLSSDPSTSSSASSDDEVSAEGSTSTLPVPSPQFIRRRSLSPKGPTDWSSIALDLAELSGQAKGALLVEVVPTALVASAAKLRLPAPVRGLFRLTDLGPLLTASRPRAVVRVNRLSDGSPVAGAEITRRVAGQPPALLGRTDAHGVLIATTTEDRSWAQERSVFVVTAPAPSLPTANTGGTASAAAVDRAYLVLSNPRRERHVQTPDASPLLRRGERVLAQIVTERDAYRPGETVRCVGWSAIESPYVASNLRRMPAEQTVLITLSDYRGRSVGTRSVTTTAEGKFFAEIPIPASTSLGGYDLRAEVWQHKTHARVKVEDYRTPEYAVSAAADPPEVVFPQRPQIRIAATYFFGGPVAIVRGSARQSCAPTSFRPPHLEADWRTGGPTVDGHSQSAFIDLMAKPQGATKPTDGRLQLAAPEAGPQHNPRRCEVSVSVSDESHQAIGAQVSYLSHPARYYLAVRPSASWLYSGDSLTYAVRAVRPDGTRVAASGVKVIVQRVYSEPVYRTVDQQRVFDRHEERIDSVPGCTLDLTAEGPDASCRIDRLVEGRYVLKLSGGPDASAAFTRSEVHVSPRQRIATYVPPPPPPHMDLWLADSRAQVGQDLVGRISAPWPVRGVLVMARQGVREHIPFAITADQGGSFPLRLRVDDTWVPAVHLEVVAVRPAQHSPDHRPRVEATRKDVTVDPGQRRLQVQVDAPSESLPGQRVPIHVRVRDHAEHATAARVALWAVDEAVLSLTQYEVPDLLPRFIPDAEARIDHLDEYRAILQPYRVTADPWLMANLGGFGSMGRGMGGSAVGSAFGAGGMGISPAARQRFETTPLFLGDVAVNDTGEATIQAQLPDNLTTFRITAIASARLVDGQSPGRFGKGDTRLRVSQPFLVRAALPRLLRPGDQAELAALLNNLGGPEGTADVELTVHQDAARPILVLHGAKLLQRPLQAGEVMRVPFSVTAQRSGQVEIELRATLRGGAGPKQAVLSDSLRLPLIVEAVPRIHERVAVYGTLDDAQPIAIPLRQPVASRPDEGGLRITTSPSLLRDLDSAAQSLIEYPYGCLEQTSSRLVPLIALSDVQRLQLSKASSAESRDRLASFLQAGVERIAAMQTDRGGFAYWPGGREPHAYASAYATWVLHLLRQAQRDGKTELTARLDALIARSSEYLLKNLSPADSDGGAIPVPMQGQQDLIRSMMAMQVLADLGRAPLPVFDALFARRAEVPVFARALLTLAMHRARPDDSRLPTLTQELLGTIGELPASAHVNEVTTYGLATLFHSSARSDAMVLWALLRTHRDHPLIPKLVRGLLARREGGVWRNTQENAYAILALAEYGRTFEATDPALVTRAWVGKIPVAGGPIRFSDRAAAPVDLRVPMPVLVSSSRDAQNALLIQREGSGRLYYRAELTWTPAAPLTSLPARAQGLRVQRQLRTARDRSATTIRLGEPAVIDLTVENRVALTYVAIDVPLPSGLEVLQRELGAGQASLMLSGPRTPQVSHEELRADRVEIFIDRLPPGTHRHTIHVRPTTPGHFVLPSAQAEAMYEPEVYGRTTLSEIDVK